MIAVELLSIKLQELFGSDYIILPYAKLCTEYTTARQVEENGNIGYIRDYTNGYAQLRKSKIIGIVNLQNPQRVNADFYYLTSSFKIDFSVPINIVKKDINGNVIETPHLQFFKKYEEVLNKIVNKTLNFANSYKGKMIISEPVFNSLEDDGETKCAIYTANGTFNVTDKAQFGADYKIEIDVNGEYIELDCVNSFVEMNNNGMNAIVKQDKTKIEQNLSQLGWVATVNISDIETTNLARKMLYDIIHENKEIINENEATEARKRKIKIRITTPHNSIHEFWSIPSITFRADRNSAGSYDISFTDDNKGV